MGLRKAWVLDSTIPTVLAEELSADRCSRPFNFGVSASFEKKREELELYSLSAWGDLEIESEYDWSHISVASRVHELKTRMKRHLRSRWASSLSTSYLEEDVKDLEYVAGGGGGLSANVGEGANNILNQTHAGLNAFICRSPDTDHVWTNSETVVTDTVADFLRQVEVLDRPTAPLSPVSSTAYLVNIPTPPSFPAPFDNNSPACTTNDNSDSETDYESSASAVLKTPCNSEDEESDADVEVYTGDDLEKTPKKERNAKSVQSVISLRAASPQPKSTSKAEDELSQQLGATSDACAASLRAFAAYHAQREMLGFQTDEDSDYEFDGAPLQDGSPIFRQTLGPSFVSASHGASRMPPRKTIPSWS